MPMRRTDGTIYRWAVAGVLVTFVLAACGGDENGGAGDGGENGAGDGGAAISVSAQDIAFDTDTITADAGGTVTIEFTNQDTVPHNVAVYETEEAQQEIFSGEIITGPNETVTYEFTAPSEAGTYFFHCDVHPGQMTGDFVVE